MLKQQIDFTLQVQGKIMHYKFRIQPLQWLGLQKQLTDGLLI